MGTISQSAASRIFVMSGSLPYLVANYQPFNLLSCYHDDTKSERYLTSLIIQTQEAVVTHSETKLDAHFYMTTTCITLFVNIPLLCMAQSKYMTGLLAPVLILTIQISERPEEIHPIHVIVLQCQSLEM